MVYFTVIERISVKLPNDRDKWKSRWEYKWEKYLPSYVEYNNECSLKYCIDEFIVDKE